MNVLTWNEQSDHLLTTYVNDTSGNAIGGATVEVTIITTSNREQVSGATWPLTMVQQPVQEKDKVILPGGDVLVDRSIPYTVNLPFDLGMNRGDDYYAQFKVTYEGKKLYVEKLIRGEVKR